ncbi:UNVERIFIED_CONTAM: hypothetical protein HDU68_011649 [Siphonaria sp. JEL0065]|nr:hypothetical protein HDU68_011649 [Siphonaria sp. JEL0065]
MRAHSRFVTLALCAISSCVVSLLCIKFVFREGSLEPVSGVSWNSADQPHALHDDTNHEIQLPTSILDTAVPNQSTLSNNNNLNTNATTEFIHWLTRIGFKNNGMRIVELGPHNRNVIATRPFKAGEVIMEMPKERTVNDISIQQDPIIRSISEKLPNSPWEALMGTFILLHRTDPQYSPFIQFLPTFVGTPLYWNETLVEFVKGTDLIRDVKIQRSDIQKTWKLFQPLLPKSLHVTFDDFQWAWLVVQSRVWGLNFGDGNDDQTVMSPMLDMVNHNPIPLGEVDYNAELGAVVMTAVRDIKVGDFIDISYGDKSSYEFLKYYGFTIPDNDGYEFCTVSISTNQTTEKFQYNHADCDFYVSELGRSIKDCNLGINRKTEGIKQASNHKQYPISDDPAMWNKIQTAASLKIATYPSTIEEDDVLLSKEMAKEEGLRDYNILNALRSRRGEKVCLKRVRSYIDGLFLDLEKLEQEENALAGKAPTNTTKIFTEWMQNNGIDTSGFEIVELQPNNRNVRATRDFKKGQVVFSMPENLVWMLVLYFLQTAQSYFQQTISEQFVLALPWESHFASFLLLTRNNPTFSPIWQFLPHKISTPLSWTTEKLSHLLNGTDLLTDLHQQRLSIKTTFKILAPHLPPATTLAEFTWAWQMFGSRVWYMGLSDGKFQCVMVPLHDMVNHDPTPNSEVDFNNNTKSVEMTAVRDIRAGEWITDSYGEKGSYDLLKYYGFTIPENDLNEGCKLEVGEDGEVCEFLVGKLEETVHECVVVGKDGKVDLGLVKKISDDAVVKLARYPTTIAEDDAVLRFSEYMDFEFVNAVRVRRAEKICLAMVAEQAERLL